MGSETAQGTGSAGSEGVKPPLMAQEMPSEAPMYYSNNAYPTHYFYDYHPGAYAESPAVPPETWEEYMRYMGMDNPDSSQQQAMYSAEMGSMYMQTPQGYGYPSPSPFSTYPPSMGVDGQLYGPQPPYTYPNPIFHSGPYLPGPSGTTVNGTGTDSVHHGTGAEQNASNGSMTISSLDGLPPPPPPPGTLNGVRGGAVAGAGGAGGVGGGGGAGGLPVPLVPAPVTYGRPPNAPQGSQDARFDGSRTGTWNDPAKGGTEGQPRPGSAMQIPLQTYPRIGGLASPAIGQLNGGRGYSPVPRTTQNGFGRGRGGVGITPFLDTRNGGGRGFNGNFDKGRGRGRGSSPMISNGPDSIFDVASEQNRGPRTIRMRGQRGGTPPPPPSTTHASVVEGEKEFNSPDFETKYEMAKFFVIKSYSEDDVHKSIKYGVWASTPTGNKRLEAAHQEAQSLGENLKGGCPVFFFFSVNASGQFCGVAEMAGPVDHTKSCDHWQQDKWNGQFKVKWHIIKDVPNGQFRHIILANNENKPVTNSRDTQEVKFEQGSEMLEIFKNYGAKTSILDDFSFYDDRQKAMQEKRARLQQQQSLRLRQTTPEEATEIAPISSTITPLPSTITPTPHPNTITPPVKTLPPLSISTVTPKVNTSASEEPPPSDTSVPKADEKQPLESGNTSSEVPISNGEQKDAEGGRVGEGDGTSAVSSVTKGIQDLSVKG